MKVHASTAVTLKFVPSKQLCKYIHVYNTFRCKELYFLGFHMVST